MLRNESSSTRARNLPWVLSAPQAPKRDYTRFTAATIIVIDINTTKITTTRRDATAKTTPNSAWTDSSLTKRSSLV